MCIMVELCLTFCRVELGLNVYHGCYVFDSLSCGDRSQGVPWLICV